MTGNPVGAPGAPEDPRRTPDKGISVGEYAGLGIQFAASIVVFLYLGQWLDRKLGTAPWFLYAGVFLGAGGSFYSMYRKLMAAQEREEAARAARKRAEP
jgi:ATP synthase protein I